MSFCTFGMIRLFLHDFRPLICKNISFRTQSSLSSGSNIRLPHLNLQNLKNYNARTQSFCPSTGATWPSWMRLRLAGSLPRGLHLAARSGPTRFSLEELKTSFWTLRTGNYWVRSISKILNEKLIKMSLPNDKMSKCRIT
jgi:hypothetical protein